MGLVDLRMIKEQRCRLDGLVASGVTRQPCRISCLCDVPRGVYSPPQDREGAAGAVATGAGWVECIYPMTSLMVCFAITESISTRIASRSLSGRVVTFSNLLSNS